MREVGVELAKVHGVSARPLARAPLGKVSDRFAKRLSQDGSVFFRLSRA